MHYKAIIFDLDGTLLDTLEDLAAAGNRVLADQGLPTHPLEAYRFFVGDGLAMLIRRILPAEMRSEERMRALADAFRKVYAAGWNVRTHPYEGVAELLDGLQERDVTMNVLSNKPHDFTEVCVREFFGGRPFAHVLGNREGVPRKPDPGGALAIAAALRLDPGEIVYLGDTATDMRTANAAGMFAVGALWGFRDVTELEESGAAMLAARPEEVLSLFESAR
ncbi:MAG: HAD family hydrolase [Desulfobulbaceae bacterium]